MAVFRTILEPVRKPRAARAGGSFVCLALVAGTLAATARPARAQTLEMPRHRQGYYISLGFASGAGHFWENGDSVGTYVGGNYNIRLGQLLTRRLGLGLQIDLGAGKKDQESAALSGLGLEGHVALVANLALHAGVGLGVVQLVDERVENEELRGSYASMYMLGLSYAFFPFTDAGKSGGFSVTPVLQVRGLPDDAASAIAAVLGVEIGWWSGLPKNQLDLPESEAYGE